MNIYRFLVLVMIAIMLIALVLLLLSMYNKDKKLMVLSIVMIIFDVALYYLLGFSLF